MTSSGDEAVRELAREILARPEYSRAEPGAIVRALERIFQALDAFIDRIILLRETAPLVYWSVVGGCLLLALLLLGHVIWTLTLALRAPEPEAPERARPPARDLAAEAEGLAAEGRTLEAAHLLMLASLQLIGRRAWIEIRPEDTNRVIRSRLGSAPLPEGMREQVDELIARTERLWFRDRVDDGSIYDAWRGAYERIAAA